MSVGFLEVKKGHKSCKRLIGTSCAFMGILILSLVGFVSIFWAIPSPYIALVSGGILLATACVIAGIATWENVVDIIKAVKE